MTNTARIALVVGLLASGAGTGWLLASRAQAPDTPLDTVTTHGEWVSFVNRNGDTVRAYIAYPERQGKAPGIIIIHEIFGLTDWEPTVADEYAAKGYVAIAPDLLSSRYGSTRALGDSARRMMGTLTTAGVVTDLDAAWDYINSRAATDSGNVGAIGFCWGGNATWDFAAHNPHLKAAVVCYGPVTDTLDLRRVQAPVLGVYGENDGRVNNALPTIARIMREQGKSFVADSYAGTGHGFLKPGRRGHGTDEAARAQRNIDAFLAERLRN
jgi:carboxymethylenebutenolidase